tara:strand:- start:11214 stop:12515 length:1302 start_codon:yes stop_codon:yes gene_type:complete
MLIDLIKNKKSVIGIIGLGYVGLPLAIRFCEENFKTIGFDIDQNKIKSLRDGHSYIKHFGNDKIISALNKDFRVTSDFKKIANVDVIIICVPTPLGIHNEPDLSFIHSTLNSIIPNLKNNQLLVLESTTYPGTTEEEIVPKIEKIKSPKFILGENFFIGYSPEREDPGNKEFGAKNTPKIVSGITNICSDLTKVLYDQIVDVTVPVSSTKVAEMTKILENIYRSVNIGLVNELKILTNKMNIDIYEVIMAASTKPFGFTPFYPGPGLGGHCIPIDPFYLSWKAKELDVPTRFIELAGEINSSMPSYVIDKVIEALNDNKKSINSSTILVMGLSYKKNVDDLRESPSLVIIEKLIKLGAKVQFCDPYFDKIPKTRKFSLKIEKIDLKKENLKMFDLVLIAVDHDIFDFNLIENEAKLIVDTRGKYKKSNKIYLA